jgi:hypothetical protein
MKAATTGIPSKFVLEDQSTCIAILIMKKRPKDHLPADINTCIQKTWTGNHHGTAVVRVNFTADPDIFTQMVNGSFPTCSVVKP